MPSSRSFLLPMWLAGFLAFSACSEVSDSPPAPRNVILVSVDTLRADALGASGNPRAKTPNLDALAARGTYFRQAIAPVPRTTPALGSLLTGLWPKTHGSRDVGDPIGEVTTLAERLQERGFTTLAMSTNSSAGPKQGLARGFDRFVTYDDLVEKLGDGLYRDLTAVSPDRPGWATATTDQALELAAEAPTDQPLFLWVFYFDPHFLYRPPSPWQDDVAAEECWQLYAEFQERPREAGQVFADVGGVASRALDACRRLYQAEVAYTDHEIGRLLEGLEAGGWLEDSLLVFTADHGENFGEGGLFFEHGASAHDAGLRVPLIFAGPGVEAGKADDGSASLVDVAPTVLSWLGWGELAETLDGTDLSPRIRPGGRADLEARRRPVFAEGATSVWNESVQHVTTGRTWWRVCINGPRYSLCEIPKEAPGIFTLYDHREDPALTRDLAAELPEEVARLREAWKSWPPENARQRVARTPEFKLVQLPRLEGGYENRLFHLASDPQETEDVKDRYPEAYQQLLAELETWAAGLGEIPERVEDPDLESTLRSLGYVP